VLLLLLFLPLVLVLVSLLYLLFEEQLSTTLLLPLVSAHG
jgi:hypothetical protein